ncbi:MAG: hypothetical protein KAQ69_04010 [Spirochaetales bacterium]|nr:hypothetical protein [Spirochaetales bacterium]
MKNRTVLWVLFSVTFTMLIIVTTGLVYFYPERIVDRPVLAVFDEDKVTIRIIPQAPAVANRESTTGSVIIDDMVSEPTDLMQPIPVETTTEAKETDIPDSKIISEESGEEELIEPIGTISVESDSVETSPVIELSEDDKDAVLDSAELKDEVISAELVSPEPEAAVISIQDMPLETDEKELSERSPDTEPPIDTEEIQESETLPETIEVAEDVAESSALRFEPIDLAADKPGQETVTEKEPEQPSYEIPVIEPRYWTVAGTYPTVNKAELGLDLLQKSGLSAMIVILSDLEYQLRLGPYESVDQAINMTSIINDLSGFKNIAAVKITLPR